MNPLWNFEVGLSVPPSRNGSHVAGGFWLPETPAKTVPLRSHTIPIHQSENLLDMLNCPELGAPSSNPYLHEIPGCSNYVQQPTNQYERMASTEEFFGLDFDFLERNHHTTNQSTGAYTLDLGIGDSTARSVSLSNILASGNMAFMPTIEDSLIRSLHMDSQAIDLNFPVQSNGWMEFDSRGMDNQALDLNFPVQSNNGWMDFDSRSIPTYQLNTDHQYMNSTSCQVSYDPWRSNVPSGIYNTIPFTPTNTIPFTPTTPDAARSKDIQVPLLDSVVDKSVNHERGHKDELLQSIVDSIKTNDGTKNGTHGGIDLNKTPQQKPSKRKKHRPKVIIEEKAKRTKTSHTPQKSDGVVEEPSQKRKYTRKEGLKETDEPHQRKDAKESGAHTPKKPHHVVGEPSSKRKYTPKEGLKEADESLQRKDGRKSGAAQVHSTKKSSRKFLNFDFEDVTAEARTGQWPVEGKVPDDKEEALHLVSNCQKMGVPTTNDILFKAPRPSASQVTQKNSFLPQYQGSMNSTTSASMDGISAPYFSLSQVQESIHHQSIRSHIQLGGDSMLDMLNRTSQVASYVASGEGSLLNGQTHRSISSALMWQRILSTLSNTQEKINTRERISDASSIIDDSGLEHRSTRLPFHDITSRVSELQKNEEKFRYYTANEVNRLSSHEYLQHIALQSKKSSQMDQTDLTTVAEHKHSDQQLILMSPKAHANMQNTSPLAIETPLPAKLQRKRSYRRNPLHASTEKNEPTTVVMSNSKGLTTIDEITNHLSDVNFEREDGVIVPYKAEGAIVPLEGKKHRPRPKVELDPQTSKMWNLLMGKVTDGGHEENSEEKEKWWENERKMFRGRVDSFIARMRLVQGDRRFSRWKGSVVDSVIGVFLTQNVSDHLSSSAFMYLSARFPLDSTSHNKCSNNGETKISVEEPGNHELHTTKLDPICNQSPILSSLPRERWGDRESLVREGRKLFEMQTLSSEEEVISSQVSFDRSTVDGSRGIIHCSGPNSESEDQGTSHKSNGVRCTASKNSLHGEMLMFHDINNQESGITSHSYGSETRYEASNEGYTNGSSPSTLPMTFGSPNMYPSSLPIRDPHLKLAPGLPVGNCNVFGEESTGSLIKAATLGEERNGSTKQKEHPSESTNKTQTTDQYHALNKHQTYQTGCLQMGSQSGITHRSQSILVDTMDKSNSNEQPSLSSKTHREENVAEQAKAREENGAKQVREETTAKQAKAKEETTAKQAKAREETTAKQGKAKESKAQSPTKIDWDALRKDVKTNYASKERSSDLMDSLDYEAMRKASISEISNTIKERGMNNMLASRMKDFLDRLVDDHGSIDLEWLRDVPPDKAKDYLLSIKGLGLKSVECVRLLTLHHLAFPVDTNVGRIAVRLGWVPLQPLPDTLQLHLLELYPILDSVQKYLWPRLCMLDQPTLYELHYHLITFGKIFCTKSKPNCNACPLRSECRHFASAFTSTRLALPVPEDKGNVGSTTTQAESGSLVQINPLLENSSVKEGQSTSTNFQPIIEEPASPVQELGDLESDTEDGWGEDDDEDEIPAIRLNMKELTENLQDFIQSNNIELQEGDMPQALVALTPGMASIPTRKLKNVSRLRTEHEVYELGDDNPLLEGMPKREPDDPSPYLLAIWTPGETASSVNPPERKCEFQNSGNLCDEKTCFSCNSTREANSQTIRGTLLIPCRTAMRGSFPLNGTYFQVNEMFADHKTSMNPMVVLRSSIWKLPRRTVYFGTSVTSIFRGMTTEQIQSCFWRGFVCVRGFDQATRAPRPLVARLHFPQSKLAKTKKENTNGK
ncbi:hypothetical protein SAY87_025927 [Trapa incisa]|uniref:HhH-GPD domain-containing protein n=1 Tax=Trapa incisa TaxID=236973 RepID=A0AAN7JKC6_9MYRT|nr:hypothetical protein SAY87_025927 [Trapa incisa]